MAGTTIGIGLALVGVGLVGYFGTGAEHPTALIPAGFGVVLAILGELARNEQRRALYMHIAVTVGLLGFLGSFMGLVRFFRLLAGEAVARPDAVKAQAAMAALTGIFVILCVRSFINARRNRTAVNVTR